MGEAIVGRVTIPATIGEAETRLGDLEALLTAREWERAAILAAYVEPDNGHGGRQQMGTIPHLLSAREFAAKGITGLTAHRTVMRHVRNWMDEVGERPAPGETVTLPDVEYPQVKSKVHDVATNPGAIAQAIERDPTLIDRVIERTPEAARPAVARQIVRQPQMRQPIRSEVAKQAVEEEQEIRRRQRQRIPNLINAHEYLKVTGDLTKAEAHIQEARERLEEEVELDDDKRYDINLHVGRIQLELSQLASLVGGQPIDMTIPR